jgi:nucleoside-diphosphate-sugar epimerase
MGLDVYGWIERLVRASVDFFGIQVVGIIALVVGGIRVVGMPMLANQRGESFLVNYYLFTFLPLSTLFLLTNACFGLYTRSRGYTLQYKLRISALSAVVSALAFIFLCFLTNRSASLSAMAALTFLFGAVSIIPGLRWLKDWMFHRESKERPEVHNPGAEEVVLVVGGAGYIGPLVIEKLLARGCKVRLLDSLVYGDQAIRGCLAHPRLEFIKGDCRNIQDVVRALAKVRNVIHLAAIVGDPACAEDGENASQINYAATRMMAEIAASSGVERFIFASSCSVYGASDVLMDENSETAPISVYAQTKLQSERVLLESGSNSFHPVILRFATVFGLAPRLRFDLVVNLLTAKAIQDGVITIFNEDQWRPFIHVQDVAEAVVQVLFSPLETVSGEIFNVGDDRLNITLAQLAQRIKEQLPQTRVERVCNSDRRNYRVSFRKIRDRVGFTAQRTVESGIIEIKEAFESGQISNYRLPAYNNLASLKEKGRMDAKDELDVKVMGAFASAGSRSTYAVHPPRRVVPVPIEPARSPQIRLAEEVSGISPSA